ncbi:MAG: RipA family octameric membrane protein [Elainellaceae cyanobacterium]
MGRMTKEKYGDQYQLHLLEQYKLYVEMADRISARRLQTNGFYITLLSGLLTLLSFLNVDKDQEVHTQNNIFFLVVGVIGLTLCATWLFNIRSFKQINSLKFKVIHEMEQNLPFPCYSREWEILKQDGSREKYLRQTKIEQFIPFILAVPYCGFILYWLRSLLF